MAEGKWVRRFHPSDGAATQLLCLPHAGGSASYFFGVAKALAPAIDVLAVQYPGRHDRLHEPVPRSVYELADRLTAAIEPFTERPITLFGHSLGAILGFEVALRLERDGYEPTALFASGRPAPSRTRRTMTDELDDAGLLATVRALGGTDAALLDDPDVRDLALPALRGDYVAAETYTYQPGPKLSCPVVALVGDDDPRATLDEARAWREHTAGEFELLVFPGGHFYLNDHVPDILDRIRRHSRSIQG